MKPKIHKEIMSNPDIDSAILLEALNGAAVSRRERHTSIGAALSEARQASSPTNDSEASDTVMEGTRTMLE